MGRGGRRSQRGFSLIELMVTLAVLVLIAAIAFEGFRRNEQTGQSRRFVSAVHGAITQARNRAIDQQTQVMITIDSTTLTLTAFDPVTETWELFERVGMTDATEGLLLQDDVVCIFGLGTGVQTPAQAQAAAAPSDCLAVEQTLRFEPDGTFTFLAPPDDPFFDVPNAGITLWIGDRSTPGQVEFSIVQVFPGGLIRTISEMS